MKLSWLSLVIMLVVESTALACPACTLSNSQGNSFETFWVLSAMGIIPLVVAAAIGVSIARMQKHE